MGTLRIAYPGQGAMWGPGAVPDAIGEQPDQAVDPHEVRARSEPLRRTLQQGAADCVAPGRRTLRKTAHDVAELPVAG